MGAAIRDHDWASTPLGPIQDWCSALRIAVGLMVESNFPKCIVWGPRYTTLYNDAFRPILGDKPEALGRSLNEVWSEVWPEIAPLVEKAYAGEPVFIEDLPLVIDRYGQPEQAWFTFCYSPVRDETGAVRGIMDTVIETTGKVMAVRTAQLLNAELSHRMKNTLAMVSAVANQTFRNAESLDAARARFADRVAALGEAHAILTQTEWTSAPILDVVEGALAPHRSGTGRFSVSGPPVMLSSRQALSLALAINELATNAVKHGALRQPEGQVSISWETAGDAFRFAWLESGGEPVAPPRRRGFGSQLTERILPADFGGRASLDFAPTGLAYSLTGQLAALDTAEAAAAAP
ncbi:sensor histidine kinase [Phreatobacter oligotrophus]|uniref:sensor histidine kinase n=1 Tax=Phreatobacter oligotrophus TaxID=1122261 RepID=UPI002352E273|nr:PAS domain-containing sensor histidine kinase [Phreatobacter oligotrophus]MBX9991106.1 PAS domain-containing protein [Phreatobacter oligotrophus]